MDLEPQQGKAHSSVSSSGRHCLYMKRQLSVGCSATSNIYHSHDLVTQCTGSYVLLDTAARPMAPSVLAVTAAVAFAA
eukprot:13426-Heterococcus_DN1.PRE.1